MHFHSHIRPDWEPDMPDSTLCRWRVKCVIRCLHAVGQLNFNQIWTPAIVITQMWLMRRSAVGLVSMMAQTIFFYSNYVKRFIFKMQKCRADTPGNRTTLRCELVLGVGQDRSWVGGHICYFESQDGSVQVLAVSWGNNHRSKGDQVLYS